MSKLHRLCMYMLFYILQPWTWIMWKNACQFKQIGSPDSEWHDIVTMSCISILPICSKLLSADFFLSRYIHFGLNSKIHHLGPCSQFNSCSFLTDSDSELHFAIAFMIVLLIYWARRYCCEIYSSRYMSVIWECYYTHVLFSFNRHQCDSQCWNHWIVVITTVEVWLCFVTHYHSVVIPFVSK